VTHGQAKVVTARLSTGHRQSPTTKIGVTEASATDEKGGSPFAFPCPSLLAPPLRQHAIQPAAAAAVACVIGFAARLFEIGQRCLQAATKSISKQLLV